MHGSRSMCEGDWSGADLECRGVVGSVSVSALTLQSSPGYASVCDLASRQNHCIEPAVSFIETAPDQYRNVMARAATSTRYFETTKSPLAIRESPLEGRFAVAKINIEPGDAVLSARCYAIALNHNCRKQACHNCYGFTLKTSLPIACSGCSSVWYCSETCRRRRSAFHDLAECRFFREIHRLSQPGLFRKWTNDAIRALKLTDPEKKECLEYEYKDLQDLGRLMLSALLRKSMEESVLQLRHQDWRAASPLWEDVMALVSNEERLGSGELAQLRFVHQLFSTLPPLANTDLLHLPFPTSSTVPEAKLSITAEHGSSDVSELSLDSNFSQLYRRHFPSATDFIRFNGIRKSNAFGLWDSANEAIGQAIYPFASYFNHSCGPNLLLDHGMADVDKEAGKTAETKPQSGATRKPDAESGDGIDDETEAALASALAGISLDSDIQETNGSMLIPLKLLTKIVENEPALHFRALHAITAGTPLTHSYIDVTLQKAVRQETLRDEYRFTCLCERCSAPGSDNPAVPDPYISKYVCVECGFRFVEAEGCLECWARGNTAR
ncbi:uncharacterized protein BJ171DRAFT_117276 [Polychytrium aggregatum]|uniref:uncharacterized protein n=1 Tax=Polychytrium aggregatum TaxID=110093 RepID=UPI0022FDB0C0|nr:uncharacterized protein BJ171DRAFT_117276 [Polychytrium aggregatum]KAI9209415.1 hypothetical protein BJ171DRAFT_117276 [Polychytrium aggregatum]